MKQIIMAALLISFSWGIRAQQLQIRGKVIDLSDKSPLEFANITLQTADSAFITGTTTDSKGLFRIEKVKAGDYQVSVSSIGYKTSVVSVLGLSQPIDLGTISLASSSISLDEVTVNASAIRNTADRKIAFPTSEQKAASSNGINLLNALMLPRLEVDPIRNSVSLPNEGTIQFCINGIKVELSDIRGLSPQEVIRVEYHDNPGLRYGNASVVLDYIVRRETSGGSVNLDLSNSPTTSLETIRYRRSSIIRNQSSDCNAPSVTGIRIISGRKESRPSALRVARRWNVPRKVCQEECPRPLITSLLIIIW